MVRRTIARMMLLGLMLVGVVVVGAQPANALTMAQQPAVSRHSDGRQIIVARDTNNTPRYSQQLYTNGPWSGWVSMGGTVTSDIAVVTDGVLLHAFARMGSGGIYWKRQINANSDDWSGWTALGGTAVSAPTAVRPVGGNVQVFVLGTDGAIWGNIRNPNGTWTGWASWGKPSGVNIVGQPIAAAEPFPGYGAPSVFVFAKGGSNSQLYFMEKPAGFTLGTWTQYGGSIHGDRVAVSSSDRNTLEVFRRVADGSIAVTRQTSPYGSWQGSWTSLGAPGGVAASDSIAAGMGYSGRLHVYVVRDDGVMYYRTRIGLDWGTWISLGGQGRSRMVAGRNLNNASVAFVIGTDRRMYQNPQSATNGSFPGFGYINSYNSLLI